MTFAINPEDLYMEFQTKRKRGRMWIIPNGSDPVFERVKTDNAIFNTLVKAHLCQRFITEGRFASMKDFPEKKDIAAMYVRRIMNLNYLSPKIKEMFLEGKQPKRPKSEDRMAQIPLLWSEQEAQFLQ
jgi:transcriptional accessory protein Tex/SPT6